MVLCKTLRHLFYPIEYFLGHVPIDIMYIYCIWLEMSLFSPITVCGVVLSSAVIWQTLSCVFTSAPAACSTPHVSDWPQYDARCSGVRPSWQYAHRWQVRHHRNYRNYKTYGIKEHALWMYRVTRYIHSACSLIIQAALALTFWAKFTWLAMVSLPMLTRKSFIWAVIGQKYMAFFSSYIFLFMIWTCGDSSILAPSLG